MWPHYQAVAIRCMQVSADIDNNQDVSVFQTSGQDTKQKALKKKVEKPKPAANNNKNSISNKGISNGNV